MVRIANGVLTLDNGEVPGAALSATADLVTTKMRHGYKQGTTFDLAIGATPVAREEIVFVSNTAGTIKGFHCLLNDTGTSTDVDFDVKINGTTAISSIVNITDSNSDRQVLDGTVSTPTLAAGDVVSIELIITTTTGAQGPFAWVEIEETGAPQ